MNQHPHLKTLHTLYTEEAQPFRKVHRMIDLFESIIKSHTVVIIAEYVQHNQLSNTAKGLLAQGLRTPSLGTWQLFSRVLFEELQAVNYAWTLSEFASGFEFLDKSLNSDKTNVIAFRNGYAHGATPSDEQCENDIRKFEPYLDKLLSLSWIEQSSIEVNEGIVYVQSEANSLSCHPIFLFRDENNEASFAFFNDLKNDKIGLLNYPLGKHYREKEFFKVFHEYLPLNEWKKSGNNEFYQRIEELTETFKGRTFERERLLQFVINESKGYCSIQGNPGIGKSALIAQFFKDLRASEKAKHVNVVEYFIRRGTAQAQTEYLLSYLIKRTDELFPQGKEVRAEGKMVFEIQQQLFSKWRLWSEHSNGKKLLFLIDGLDEGVENNIVSYLPRENFQDILIIYGSRPGGHKTIDELWVTLPLESHSKIELSGLSKEDIRALIYEVANKYDLEKDSEWIEAVQKRSQGNPLYLKLLCDSIENGGIALNDLNALPSKIDEYYKAILLRYAQDPDGDALLAGLYTFAAAKDYLTMAHLGLINQLGDATLERIGSTLKEVLYENPLTEDVLDFQLFHESFREYLIKEKTLKVSEAKQRITEFCGRWKEFEGQWEQRYVLEHYASHLHESIKEHHSELLLKLIYDTDFQTTQKKVLRGFEATNTLFRLALLKASDIKRFDEQLEAGLCLVDLKYEEANDAPQIVAMVANGEIDLALKRIESFGGSDKEGIQRKFILYMLCLMELTLLESKDKPFRKDAIQKLLHHLDEQIPPDTSLINWNDFFPSYLIFLMAFQWAELGLDYLIVFRRTEDWEKEWVNQNGHLDEISAEVLKSCTMALKREQFRSNSFREIAINLACQGQLVCAIDLAKKYCDNSDRSVAFSSISEVIAEKGDFLKAFDLLEDAIESALSIKEDYDLGKSKAIELYCKVLTKLGRFEKAMECISSTIFKQNERETALFVVSSELANIGRGNEAASILQEVCDFACNASEKKTLSLSESLVNISAAFCVQGHRHKADAVLQMAIENAREIPDKSFRSVSLTMISSLLAKQGDRKRSEIILEESINCVLFDSDFDGYALSLIAEELANQGLFDRALVIMDSISQVNHWSFAMKSIASELTNREKMKEAVELIQKAGRKSGWYCRISAIKKISTTALKFNCLKDISDSLLIAIESYRDFDDYKKNKAISQISLALAKTGCYDRALKLSDELRDVETKNSAFLSISRELAREGKFKAAIECTRKINGYKIDRIQSLSIISEVMYSRGEYIDANLSIKEAQEYASEMSDDNRDKIRALLIVATEMFNQSLSDDAAILMKAVIDCARLKVDESEKVNALLLVFYELCKQSKPNEASILLQEAIDSSTRVDGLLQRIVALLSISAAYRFQGMPEKAVSTIHETVEIADCIKDEFVKSLALSFISEEMVKQANPGEAMNFAMRIVDLECQSTALAEICLELTKQNSFEMAYDYAQNIIGTWDKSTVLSAISLGYSMLDDLTNAELVACEIPDGLKRHSCWKSFASIVCKKIGWINGLGQFSQLKNDEACMFYLKGWAETLDQKDADARCLKEALPILANDSDSIESLLQSNAFNDVFFGNINQKKINRFNRTLNIQWAIDIASKFPKAETKSRLSTNLESWLHEIADEDDRDQIKLWAKQVAKGKITEEEFAVKIKVYK